MFVLSAMTGYKNVARKGGISEIATIICNYNGYHEQVG